MNLIRHICLTIGQLFKQVCLLPKTIANVAELRRQRIALNELEADRLDRIRNPSKYRGR